MTTNDSAVSTTWADCDDCGGDVVGTLSGYYALALCANCNHGIAVAGGGGQPEWSDQDDIDPYSAAIEGGWFPEPDDDFYAGR